MAATRTTVGVGYKTPTAPVPALCQRLIRATTAVTIVTHGPHIVCRYSRCPREIVVARTGVGAGHDAPPAAIPVLHQRLVRAAAVGVVARRPQVAVRCGHYTLKFAGKARTRAGHDAPTAAVPVLYQRSTFMFAH